MTRHFWLLVCNSEFPTVKQSHQQQQQSHQQDGENSPEDEDDIQVGPRLSWLFCKDKRIYLMLERSSISRMSLSLLNIYWAEVLI